MNRYVLLIVVFIFLFLFSSAVYADGVFPNGGFVGNASGWSLVGSSPCEYYGGVGHTSSGSVRFGTACDVSSSAFYPSGDSELSAWVKQYDSAFGWTPLLDWVVHCDSGSFSGSFVLAEPFTDWQEILIDVSGGVGSSCVFSFTDGTNFTTLLMDDIFVSAASNDGSTATPVATFTSVPTSTSIPTSAPVGTLVSGGGSGGLCPSSDPCYVIVANTPLPVDLVGVGGTPVSGGGAIPVTIQTPVVTSVAVADVASGGGLVSVSSPSEYFDSRSVDGHIGVAPLGDTSSPDVSQVVDFRIEQQTLTLCPPAQLAQILVGVSCFVTPVFTFPRFVLAGIDLMPFATLLLGVLLFVVIMRNVQHN
jgi:hypothetical protein